MFEAHSYGDTLRCVCSQGMDRHTRKRTGSWIHELRQIHVPTQEPDTTGPQQCLRVFVLCPIGWGKSRKQTSCCCLYPGHRGHICLQAAHLSSSVSKQETSPSLRNGLHVNSCYPLKLWNSSTYRPLSYSSVATAPVLLLTAKAADRSSWPCDLCWPWAATAGPAVHTWWSFRSGPSPPLFRRCCCDPWPSGYSGMSPRCQSNYYYCCFLRTFK